MLSKKQQRKQDKAQHAAERKAARKLAGEPRKRRKPSDQHRAKKAEVKGATPETAYYECNACSSTDGCQWRTVAPYTYTFRTYVKGRWCGLTLRELFALEFEEGLSASYCDQAIHLGLIRINDKPSTSDYVIRSGDLLTHLLHRHEPPVHLAKGSGAGLVHHETDDFVVVDKPASLPVHPSGLYHHNSLTVLLAKEHKTLPQLYPVHRLDRLTSGLLLLAKSAAHAKQVGEEISSRNVRKHYVARVHGAFPSAEGADSDSSETLTADLAFPIASQDKKRVQVTREQVDGEWFWRMNAPLGRADATGNVRSVTLDTDSQHAETLFRRLRTIEGAGQSLLECRPLTGRTHQIRAHLQHLGFPIVNDPIYGSTLGEQDASQVRQLPDMSSAVVESSTECLSQENEEDHDSDSKEQLTLRARSLCVNCRQGTRQDNDAVPVSLPLDFAMGLHAFKYEAETWSFTVPFPYWATS